MAKAKITSRNPVQIGAPVMVRSVTMYYTGRIVELTERGIVLDESAWIADTGRFSTALKTGALNEVEPFPSVVLVHWDAIVDVCPWPHALPRDVK